MRPHDSHLTLGQGARLGQDFQWDMRFANIMQQGRLGQPAAILHVEAQIDGKGGRQPSDEQNLLVCDVVIAANHIQPTTHIGERHGLQNQVGTRLRDFPVR